MECPSRQAAHRKRNEESYSDSTHLGTCRGIGGGQRRPFGLGTGVEPLGEIERNGTNAKQPNQPEEETTRESGNAPWRTIQSCAERSVQWNMDSSFAFRRAEESILVWI